MISFGWWSRSIPVDPMTQIHIIRDDLSGEPTRDLLRLHVRRMRANSPPGTSFALDLTGLQAPGVTVWSGWVGSRIAGVGALKDLADGCGEVKSMCTHPDFLRQGIARALLEHIIRAAQDLGMRKLSLETGNWNRTAVRTRARSLST